MAKRVKSPDGDEWLVSRRWMDRRVPQVRWEPIGIKAAEESSTEKGVPPIETGFSAELGGAIIGGMFAYGTLFIALVGGVPVGYVLLFFVLLTGSLALGLALRPWIVEARNMDHPENSAAFPVKGWQRSGEIIEALAGDIEKAGLPERIPVPQF